MMANSKIKQILKSKLILHRLYRSNLMARRRFRPECTTNVHNSTDGTNQVIAGTRQTDENVRNYWSQTTF